VPRSSRLSGGGPPAQPSASKAAAPASAAPGSRTARSATSGDSALACDASARNGSTTPSARLAALATSWYGTVTVIVWFGSRLGISQKMRSAG